MQVLKQRTKYADALSGQRPKGADVGNWLERDPDWSVKQPRSVDERIDNFKAAYVKQTEKRKLEESVQLFKNPESGESGRVFLLYLFRIEARHTGLQIISTLHRWVMPESWVISTIELAIIPMQ